MLLVTGCSAHGGDQHVTDGVPPTSAFTEVWYAPDGDPAEHGEGRDRTFEVTPRVGADHCDWQSVVFLSVAWPLGSTYEAGADAVPFRQYVRDREGRVSGPLMNDLDLDARLPDDAAATGYRTERVELWLGPDRGDRHVYMRTERRRTVATSAGADRMRIGPHRAHRSA